MGLAHRGVIVKTKAIGLLGGVVFGFTLAWAHLTDPHVIRDMLLLKEPHVFLIMGSAVAIAAVGVRVMKATGHARRKEGCRRTHTGSSDGRPLRRGGR